MNYSIVRFDKVEQKHDVVCDNIQLQKTDLVWWNLGGNSLPDRNIVYIWNLRGENAKDQHQGVEIDYWCDSSFKGKYIKTISFF